jgi:hypothetical protein
MRAQLQSLKERFARRRADRRATRTERRLRRLMLGDRHPQVDRRYRGDGPGNRAGGGG